MTITNALAPILGRLDDQALSVDELAVKHRLAHISTLTFRRREWLKRQRVEEPAVVFLAEGSKEVHAGGGRRECFSAGDCFLIPTGITVDMLNIPDPVTGRYVAFVIDLHAPLLDRFRAGYDDVISAALETARAPDCLFLPLTATEALLEALRILTEAMGRGEELAPLVVEHRVMEILLQLLPQPQAAIYLDLAAGDFVTRLEQRIAMSPGDPWRLDDVATAFGLSKSTLKRKLSQSGTTLKTMVTTARLDHSRRLLAANDLTVQQVAHACGFDSASHFSRLFRQHYDLPPSALRQQPGE